MSFKLKIKAKSLKFELKFMEIIIKINFETFNNIFKGSTQKDLSVKLILIKWFIFYKTYL